MYRQAEAEALTLLDIPEVAQANFQNFQTDDYAITHLSKHQTFWCNVYRLRNFEVNENKNIILKLLK